MKWNALLKRELHPILTQPKIASQTKLLIDTKTKQTNKNKLYKIHQVRFMHKTHVPYQIISFKTTDNYFFVKTSASRG